MTRIILVRHCEAEGNIKRVFQGHTDAQISENGKKQLDLLRLRCQDMPIDVIYSSPLMRAYQTAEAINFCRNLMIHIHEGLIEIDGGEWEGCCWTDIPVLFPEEYAYWNQSPCNFAPKYGESMRHVYTRIKNTILELVHKHTGKQICVVSHGCAIRNFLC